MTQRHPSDAMLAKTRARILARAKARILRAIDRRELPRKVRTFSALHDHLDANMLLLAQDGEHDPAVDAGITMYGVAWGNRFYGDIIASLDTWLAGRSSRR
jgi:hypothetical protein